MRVLVLTADIGAGHDLPAELLADGIRDARPGRRGRRRGRARRDGPVARTPSGAAGRRRSSSGCRACSSSSTGCSTVFAPDAPPRVGAARAGRRARAAEARPALPARRDRLDLSREHRDHRRAAARGPHRASRASAAITDLAALRYWAHPGMDRAPDHPRRVARRGRSRSPARAPTSRHVRGLSRPGVRATRPPAPRPAPRSACRRRAARARVGRRLGRRRRRGRRARPRRRRGATVVLPVRDATPACGRGWGARSRGDPRVRVEGFTDAMCELPRRRRRARALDRRADHARGPDVRDAGDLLRLGRRAHPRQQPRLPALRARRGGRHPGVARGRAAARARRAARARPLASPRSRRAADAVLELAAAPAVT